MPFQSFKAHGEARRQGRDGNKGKMTPLLLRNPLTRRHPLLYAVTETAIPGHEVAPGSLWRVAPSGLRRPPGLNPNPMPSLQVPNGGWFPLVIAGFLALIQILWWSGSRKKSEVRAMIGATSLSWDAL